MILHYTVLNNDIIEFGWSEGRTKVDVKIPYDKFNETAAMIEGDLHKKTEAYIKMMFHLADLLS